MSKTVSNKRVWLAGATLLLVLAGAAVLLWSPWQEPRDPRGLSLLDCGAVPDDGEDDFEAIKQCIAEARASGGQVFIPEGQFHASDIIEMDGVSLIGAGPEVSEIVSTNPARGSIDLSGEDVALRDFKHTYESTVPRGNGANDKNSITVRGANGFTISGIHIDKSSTAGILIRDQATDGIIRDNLIENTGADGIHVTSGSNNMLIEGNVVRQAGDDTIAVVSYARDGGIAHRITIRDNDVGYQSRARGISVVGGEDIEIEGNTIQLTDMAGIYISVEEQYDTNNTNRITVHNNIIDSTGLRENSDHPNILVYASQGTLDDVTFTNNTIKNATHSGIGVWGEGQIGDIYFRANKVIDSAGSPTAFKKGDIHLEENQGFE
ncbi:right-handed parallel beta-helix repeat-containing protein [Paenibacillus sp. 1P07SE]|uniref:right-handed parallel beta-helix repeat-containing protein n=1 Tax=Paenibacillus sp. 1P07SE TaxID=3132209 RepID=UPI0039A59493